MAGDYRGRFSSSRRCSDDSDDSSDDASSVEGETTSSMVYYIYLSHVLYYYCMSLFSSPESESESPSFSLLRSYFFPAVLRF